MGYDNSPRVWLLLDEAADYVRLSPSTLERLIRRGHGPRSRRAGRRKLVFHRDDLDAWLIESAERGCLIARGEPDRAS